MKILKILALFSLVSCSTNTGIQEVIEAPAKDGTIKEDSETIHVKGVELNNEEFVNKVLWQLGLSRENVEGAFMPYKRFPGERNEKILVIPEIVNRDPDDEIYNSHIVIANSMTADILYKYYESAETGGWYSNAEILSDISIDTSPYLITVRSYSAFIEFKSYLASSCQCYNNNNAIHNSPFLFSIVKSTLF